MGLRDKYMNANQTATPPEATVLSILQTGGGIPPGGSAVPAASNSGPAAASPATSSADPASELAALRAKLAGRGNVNPPEATIPDDAMTRTTRETADGGAEAIPPDADSDSADSTPTVGTAAEAPAVGRKPRSKRAAPPAAAEAPSAARANAPASAVAWIPGTLERIANALEEIASHLAVRSRE